MNIKELFDKAENGVLNYDQFVAATTAAKAKFADLSEGGYVSKQKYDDDISAKDSQISTLNTTIANRDTDLTNIRTQLSQAGVDKSKLTQLETQLQTLQTQYDTDTRSYQDKLSRQAYEFAVKDFANSKKFTSNAAKRDFIQSMISKELKMEGDKILGAEDFVTAYSTDNSDAFVVDKPDPTPNIAPPLPTFVNSTPGITPPPSSGFGFNFIGVRPRKEN